MGKLLKAYSDLDLDPTMLNMELVQVFSYTTMYLNFMFLDSLNQFHTCLWTLEEHICLMPWHLLKLRNAIKYKLLLHCAESPKHDNLMSDRHFSTESQLSSTF